MNDSTKSVNQKERPASLYDYDEDFFQKRFSSEPAAGEGDTFEDFKPAYLFGIVLRSEYHDFDLNETAIRERWEAERGSSRLDWDRAREPVRIAWFQDREFAEAKPEEMFSPGR